MYLYAMFLFGFIFGYLGYQDVVGSYADKVFANTSCARARSSVLFLIVIG